MIDVHVVTRDARASVGAGVVAAPRRGNDDLIRREFHGAPLTPLLPLVGAMMTGNVSAANYATTIGLLPLVGAMMTSR